MAPTAETARTRKGEQTKQRIVDCALRRFRRDGYDATTMRAVADDAGVSLGNAYYYFKSKEHLITAFYAESHELHELACNPILEEKKDLKDRLRALLRTRIDTGMPYHRFSLQVFRTAVDPESPLSPFSDEQEPVRRKSIELCARTVRESTTKVAGKLADELPGLIWTYQMGVILYWIHDRSDGCAKTYKLIEHTVDIVVTLIKLSRLPPMRPLVTRTLKLMAELKPL